MSKVDVKIFINKKQNLKWIFTPTFKEEFCTGATAIQKEKCKVNVNKAVYSGTRIFDLSKVLMEDFGYNYIKNKCGYKVEMFQIDINSVMYKTKVENGSIIIQKIKNITMVQIT